MLPESGISIHEMAMYQQTNSVLYVLLAVDNSVHHVAFFCPSVENVRKNDTELRFFRNNCHIKGFSEDYTFSLYVNGKDWNENFVEPEEFMNRGADLQLVLDAWLSKW